MDYESVMAQLVAWAEQNVTVRALILAGSAAAGPTHPLSDRDVEIYTTDSAAVLADESWWSKLGEVLVVERLENPGWHPSRLVYYAGGKLDFTIISTSAMDSVERDRPFTVLMDKDGAASVLREQPRVVAHPTEAMVEEQLNWAYAAAIMEAKAIVRDEPWSSKARDRDLKDALLQLIEWDHQARYGLNLDVRFLGSRMRTWMDADIQTDLENCWGHFDGQDSTAALHSTLTLVDQVSTRLAGTLRYKQFHHHRLGQEVDAILTTT